MLAPLKSASTTIAFFHNVNLHGRLPTQSPAVGIVRPTATKKFGLTPKGRKDPFQWPQVAAFALAYGVHHQGTATW